MDFRDGMAASVQQGKKINIYMLYSVLFLALSAIIFSEFVVRGLSFVNKGDGFLQHVRALLYYSRYLREIAGNLFFNHKLVIPQWDFAIAEGADVLTTFQYYAIGDPLNIIAVFFPDEYIGYAYTFISILRMYLSGLSFMLLCRETDKISADTPVVVGALSYAFGFFAVNASGGNVFNLNYLIYFPLLILGFEKVIKGKRAVTLVLAVFLAGLSNMVLFSVMGIMMSLYSFVRLLMLFRDKKEEVIPVIIKTAASVALGIGMAAVILCPMGYSLINNPRNSFKYKVLPLIPMDEILEIPGNLLSGWDASYGFFGILIPGIVLSLSVNNEKIKKLRLAMVFLWIMFFVPAFSNAVNFFSGYERRWGFALSLLYSYLLVIVWEYYKDLRIIQLLISMGIIVMISVLSFITGKINYAVVTGIIASFLFSVSLYSAKKYALNMDAVMTLMSIAVIIASDFSMLHFDIEDGRFRKAGSLLDRLYANETLLVKEADDGSIFSRYTGNLTINGGTTAGMSSTSFYWSNINPYGVNFRNDLELTGTDPIAYSGYDTRSVASEIAGCVFFIKDEEGSRIPYGYNYLKEDDVNKNLRKSEKDIKEKTLEIYKNSNPLPLSYTYDSFLPYSDFMKMDAVSKEQAMLTSAVLPDGSPVDDYEKGGGCDNVSEIPFSVEADDNIVIDNGRIITYEPYSELKLYFDTDTDKETMINLKNIRFKPVYNYNKFFGDKPVYDPENRYPVEQIRDMGFGDKIRLISEDIKKLGTYTQAQIELEYGNDETKRYVQRTPYEKKYNNRNSVVFNLGFTDNASVGLIIIKPGIYEFDTSVYNVSFDDYDKKVDKRKEYVLENLGFDTNEVSGTVDIPDKKLLFLSIPYADGWRAYVDGEENRILPANDMFMALPLGSGKHDVVLKYHTPFSTAGWVLSAISFIIFLLYLGSPLFIGKIAAGKYQKEKYGNISSV